MGVPGSREKADYENMEVGFATDLCSEKKCWKAVLLPTAVWIFFTCIREKAGFFLAHIYSAIKVLHICWWH